MWTPGAHQVLINLLSVPVVVQSPRTTIHHSVLVHKHTDSRFKQTRRRRKSWCEKLDPFDTYFGLSMCQMLDQLLLWVKSPFRDPLACRGATTLRPHEQFFPSVKEQIRGRYECERRSVGRGIFFSGSSTLMLELRDAFECQQLAVAQNAREKKKGIGGRGEGFYLISPPFIFNSMQLLCSSLWSSAVQVDSKTDGMQSGARRCAHTQAKHTNTYFLSSFEGPVLFAVKLFSLLILLAGVQLSRLIKRCNMWNSNHTLESKASIGSREWILNVFTPASTASCYYWRENATRSPTLGLRLWTHPRGSEGILKWSRSW